MADTIFEIGAEVSCTDGACGKVRRLEVDPAGRAVTHLVVEPEHRRHSGRLVPVDLVEGTTDKIRLRCTLAQFEKLDPAEGMSYEDSFENPGDEQDPPFYLLPFAGQRGSPASHVRRTISYDSVPPGDVQVRRGDHVQATDGEIGLVEGLVIDPDDHQVTHVLLQEGHLWGRREVAIPIRAVTGMKLGVQLSLTRQEVAELPPVDIDRSRR